MATTLSSVTILSPVSADAYFRTDLGLLVAQHDILRAPSLEYIGGFEDVLGLARVVLLL